MKTPIKKIRVLTAALLLCTAILISGCSVLMNFQGRRPELPANAASFRKYIPDSSSMTFIDVNGRTYAPFGTLSGKIKNSSFRECLGYVDNDKNDRVYTLDEEPFGNYLVTMNVSGIMEQPVFWRDRSTYGEDIFTPEYIAPVDDDFEWGRSGCYREMKEFKINITIGADDVKELSMYYKVNGVDCGTCGVGNAVGGIKNPDGKLPLKNGEVLSLSISEISLYGKFDKNKPFDAECRFNVESVDGKLHELCYVYKGNVRLGDEDKLALTGNATDGYKIGK